MAATTQDSGLVLVRFSFDGDDDEIFEGFHDPNRTWNGWLMPLATEPVAEDIAQMLVDMGGDGWEWEHCEPGDIVVFGPEAEEFRFVQWEGAGPAGLYNVAEGLCWMDTD